MEPSPAWPGRRRRRAPWAGQRAVLAVIAAGGALGAAARYGAALAWPTAPGAFPWTTLWVNVVGCAAIGVLMVLVAERGPAHPLVRPFLGTGVLGGFTTFSTYAVEAERLVAAGRIWAAFGYLALTVAAALAAVTATVVLMRRVTRRR